MTKYYWFCWAEDEQLRRLGANHLCPTQISWNGIVRSTVREKEYIFQAEDGFELFCKIIVDQTPVELTEKQYKRIVRGESVKVNDNKLGRIINQCRFNF
jgi:NOL1/NOP2/fmu family ribosome biogenesis protein